MGKYKHGEPNELLDLADVRAALAREKLNLRKKAYTFILYWLGCRRSEPLYIMKENIEEKDGSLFITIPALKGGKRGGPIELPLSYYGVDLIKEAWQKTKKAKPIFPFSAKTGYRIVKQLFPEKTPHWFRHNRVTKLRKQIDGDTVTLDDVKSFTGIKSDSTIEHYGMKTQAGIHKVSKVLD